ncbi:MAG: capsular polysaccharide export protein, LipB/KpsS family [Paracoccaceae bacterium]
MEQIRSPLAAHRAASDGKTVVIHADEGWLKLIRDGEVDFFSKLSKRLTRESLALRLVAKGGASSRVLMDQDHVQVVVGEHCGYGRNILHAAPSYVWGFWYFDEVGINWNSSLRFTQFCPDRIDADKAEYFFNGMSSYMLRENVSRIAQEPREASLMAEAAAVVFCQEIEEQADRCHYLSTEVMIRTTAEAHRDALVYVKLHPHHSKRERLRIMAICSDYTNVLISAASVHDLSQAARVVVTQNSAAGFEALMQKKPVITCARSDFWHATLSPRTVGELGEALKYGAQAMAGFEYQKYLYWFLDRKCLEPQKDEFATRAFARIRDKAFL